MTYEIEFFDDNTRKTVRVDALDEEAALFVAGMKFSDMDINTDRISIGLITNLGVRI